MTKNTNRKPFPFNSFSDEAFVELYEKTYNRSPNKTETEHFVNFQSTYVEIGKKGTGKYKKITVAYFHSTIKKHIKRCQKTQGKSLVKNFVVKIEPKGAAMKSLILYVVPAEEATDAHLLGSVELMIKDDSMFIPHRVCSLDSDGNFNG